MTTSDSLFRKSVPRSRADQLRWEVAGLHWLAETGPDACRVVPVLAQGEGWLEEPRLRSVPPTAAAAREFGAALAHTHAAGASTWGARPPHTSGDGWIGGTRLPFPDPAHAPQTWGAFYADFRIRPYLNGPFRSDERRLLLDLCDALSDGELDHPQPQLVRQGGHTAARIHGDLWSGNVMWTAQGATLIDPAAQGAHAEDDLGALSLFGVPHFAEIIAGYHEASALAPGWEDRLELHQLHLLMVHCVLFGRSYVGQTVEVAARCRRGAR